MGEDPSRYQPSLHNESAQPTNFEPDSPMVNQAPPEQETQQFQSSPTQIKKYGGSNYQTTTVTNNYQDLNQTMPNQYENPPLY